MNTDIPHFLQFTDQIATSGQPAAHHFLDIKEGGYSAVINLATSSSKTYLANEDYLATELGLIYVHIPIPWEAPQEKHFKTFRHTLNTFANEKVWVHCALNMRASCFTYLYTILEQGLAEEDALRKMNLIWEPNDKWQSIINSYKAISP